MERFNLRVLSPPTALQKAEADIYENVAPTFAQHHIGIGTCVCSTYYVHECTQAELHWYLLRKLMVRVLAPASKKPEHTSCEAHKPATQMELQQLWNAIWGIHCTLYTLHNIIKSLPGQLGYTLMLSHLTLSIVNFSSLLTSRFANFIVHVYCVQVLTAELLLSDI